MTAVLPTDYRRPSLSGSLAPVHARCTARVADGLPSAFVERCSSRAMCAAATGVADGLPSAFVERRNGTPDWPARAVLPTDYRRPSLSV